MKKKDIRIFKNNLRKTLGFRPKNISLYQIAFIHKSATHSNNFNLPVNNERLEFLGDAILEAIVSDFLFNKYPEKNEGFLTKTRAKIVNTKKLASISNVIKLFKFLQINTENELNKENLYADTLEALIGAIYLDKGYLKTKKFIENKIINEQIDLDLLISIETNHKSNLIEWTQKKNFSINFETIEFEEDIKLFESKVYIDSDFFAIGYGKTKKDAEQMSALNAMKIINPSYKNGEDI